MSNPKYRIPDISEFKQGFKFEVLVRKKGEELGVSCFGKWNGFDIVSQLFVKKSIWAKQEVWWDRKPELKKITYQDIDFEYIESPMDLMPPYSIESYLKDKKIRVKIK